MNPKESIFERCPHDKENPYVMVSREMAQDPTISPKAKGVLLYLLSLPHDWKIYHSQLQQGLNVGEDYVNSSLDELIEAGYVDRTRERIKGIYQPYKYKIREFKKSLPNGENQTGLASPVNPELQKNDKIKRQEENKKENDNVRDRDRSFENLNPIVSFDPETYMMPNGNYLTIRCQRAFKKYQGADLAKLLANIEYFENIVKNDSGVINQEKYLQNCINKNYAGKEVNKWQNRMYAEINKSECKVFQMNILKTCVQFYNEGRLSDTISLELPVNTFSDIIDAYVKKGHS